MPTSKVHPLVWTFLKLTALIAVGYFVIMALGALLHTVVIAAAIAAVVLGGFFLYNLFRRFRGRVPVVK